MRRYSINQIASVITEDPDILAELDTTMDQTMEQQPPSNPVAIASATPDMVGTEPKEPIAKPSTAIEVEKQAEVMAGEDPDQDMMDQIRGQEEAQRQIDLERQRLLEPQMDELRSSMSSLGTGITQGAAATRTGNDSFSGLDRQMAKINAIVGNLEKQL